MVSKLSQLAWGPNGLQALYILNFSAHIMQSTNLKFKAICTNFGPLRAIQKKSFQFKYLFYF
jgi:hypothetical protein